MTTTRTHTPVGKPAKGRLTAKELRQFRDMLLDKRRSLLGDVHSLQAEIHRGMRGEADGAHSAPADHLADHATDCREMEMAVGLLAGERELLREIDEALDRIDNGTYGICLATGALIGKARLRARPWAKYCIEYARQMERGQGVGGYARREDEGERISAGAGGEDEFASAAVPAADDDL